MGEPAGSDVVEAFVKKNTFDAVTREAADAISRRKSMMALGGMALAAALAETKSVSGKKKRAKKQVKKKCKRQVLACRNFFSGFCTGIPECEDEFFPCCDQLATCDAGGMLTCLFSCGCSGMPTSYRSES